MISLPIDYAETDRVFRTLFHETGRSMAFTAAEPNSGTSTVAYAVAQRAVAAGHRVLFLDLNVHNSFAENMLSVPRTDWNLQDESIESAIYEIVGSKLAILSAPLSGFGGMEFRNKASLQHILERWRNRFDYIVGDLPCIVRANASRFDTATAASAFNHTILIAPSGSVTKTILQNAMERLSVEEVNVAGVVLIDRDAPALGQELHRQIEKISGRFPRIASMAQQFLKRNRLFHVEI